MLHSLAAKEKSTDCTMVELEYEFQGGFGEWSWKLEQHMELIRTAHFMG
jgi:hypothetical protein